MGRWSCLFGYSPSPNTIEPQQADRLADEARDYKVTMGLRLDGQAARLLDRLASLSDPRR